MRPKTTHRDQYDDQLSRIAEQLQRAQNILFITGAGLSVDSGLPTYRGAGGLYNENITEEGFPIEQVLSGAMLESSPEVTWKYLSQIESRGRCAHCNQAHKIISRMQSRFARVWVLTQNIDGFHQEARSKNVIDIHGDLHRLYCPACGWRAFCKDYAALSIPPLCPDCNGVVRPDVVFFGEMLAQEKIGVLQRELDQGFDVYFSIGTTSVFPYIQLPILDAKRRGKFTVEINPCETNISHLFDARLPVGASTGMEAVWKKYCSRLKLKGRNKKFPRRG